MVDLLDHFIEFHDGFGIVGCIGGCRETTDFEHEQIGSAVAEGCNAILGYLENS